MSRADLLDFLRDLPLAFAMLLLATAYLVMLSAPHTEMMLMEQVRDVVAMADY